MTIILICFNTFTDVSCPLFIEANFDKLSWSSSTDIIKFTASRTPGSEFSFACLHEYGKVAEPSANRNVSSGTMECLPTYEWSTTYDLPCACELEIIFSLPTDYLGPIYY